MSSSFLPWFERLNEHAQAKFAYGDKELGMTLAEHPESRVVYDNDGSGGGNGVLGIGDECTWKGADEDVPRGTVGTVVALHEDGDVEVSFPAPRSRGGGSNVSPFLRNIACLFACATDSSTISATDRPFFCFVYTVLLLQLFDGFAMSVCCCCSLYPLARS